ncbi:hypothetical protein IPJ72_06840 [Candidatus Peregrinibacteria bacterium]|nr:MAG: hypothetical protein IPJ72_06840 [Candidatus Peregrinibacteria bacterium]
MVELARQISTTDYYKAALTKPNGFRTPDDLGPFADQLAQLAVQIHGQVAVTLDAPSGAGKSCTAQQLIHLVGLHHPEVSGVHVEGDRYLGTLRGTWQREAMTSGGPADFWQRIHDWQALTNFLGRVASLGVNGGIVPMGKTYEGDYFRYDRMSYIPQGPKVMVVTGLRLGDAVAEVYGQRNTIRTVLSVDPAIALMSSLVRDLSNGRITDLASFRERLEFRLKEYANQLPAFGALLSRTGEDKPVVFDYNTVHPPLANLKEVLLSQLAEWKNTKQPAENPDMLDLAEVIQLVGTPEDPHAAAA